MTDKEKIPLITASVNTDSFLNVAPPPTLPQSLTPPSAAHSVWKVKQSGG